MMAAHKKLNTESWVKSPSYNNNAERQRTYNEVSIKRKLTAAKPCSFGRDYRAFLYAQLGDLLQK